MRRYHETFRLWEYLLFAVVTLAVLCLCVCIGSVRVPLGDTLAFFAAKLTGGALPEGLVSSIMPIRLPRVLCVALTGAALSLAGAAMQGLLKNPLNAKDVEIVMTEKSPADLTDEELAKMSDAEIISVFVHAVDVGAQVLEKFPNLKLIALRSTGFNNVDLDYCKEHGIYVCNVPGYGDSTVAEFAFGLLLDVTRKISRSYRAVQEAHVDTDHYLGFDLRGRTIGIVGTGAIGRYAARIAKGFQMNVLAYDPYPNEAHAQEIGFEYVTLDEMFEKADIFSLHCPLTKENYHLFDEDAFAKMKKL